MSSPKPSAGDVIRSFYRARRDGNLATVASFIAPDVVWREPEVDAHMGDLNGVDAVIDMMRRAGAATGGSFTLDVETLVEVDGHCAAVIRWQARKGDQLISGSELATFSVRRGRITFAQFLPGNITDDQNFWA